jgi:hypothetical protein
VLGGDALLGGAAVVPGARGDVGAAPPGAPTGAELLPCGEAGAADPGAPAGSGAGSVPGAATDPAVVVAVVGVVDDDFGSEDVDVDRRAC